MSTEPSAVRGEVTWITAEDGGGGPDEGLAIGLGAGRYFYVGYISDDTWRNHGSAYTMDNTGWWLVTGPDMVPMARFPTPDDGREFIDLMAGLLQQKPPLFRVSPDGSISIVNETQMADPLTEVRDDPWDEFDEGRRTPV